MSNKQSLYSKIYDMVRRIPSGQVATYGQISRLIGTCSPRNVGYAMASVQPEHDIPWFRVINSRGRISARSDGQACDEQRSILEQEGVRLGTNGRIDLEKYGWKTPLDLINDV